MSPPTEHYNEPDQAVNNTWTLNTDDLNFGVHVVQIQGVIQSAQIGPQSSTGDPIYTYLGCFQDNTNGKLLPNQLYAGNNNTNDLCQNLATPGGYVFSGTEYQIECYAGNTPPPLSLQVQDSLCNFACAGNQNDTCGGPSGAGLISVFYDATRYTPGSNATSAPGGLPIPSDVGNFTYSGCWSDNVNGRALDGFAPTAPASGTTYQSCAAACIGWGFFGVEFSNQCYCGNSMNNGAALQASTNPDVNGCGMFCQGNSSQYCGGPNLLNVFQYNGTVPAIPSNGAGNNGNNNNNNNNNNGGATGPAATTVTQNITSDGYYSYFGCWLDNVAGRALAMEPLTGQKVTPDTCAAACSGYQYFGLEYSDECYCANSIGGDSTIAPGGDNSAINGCNMACAGASNLTCGGPNRLSVYSLNANANVTRIVDPVTVGNFGSWNYQGCYSEATNGRALSQVQMPIPGSSVTVQTCAVACSQYLYFGVEYSSQCFCSNSLAAGSNLVAGSTPASTGCNMLCAANSTQYCGGPNRLNLYMASQAQSSISSSISSMSSSAPAQTSTSLSSSFVSSNSAISAVTSSGASNSSGQPVTFSSSSYSPSVTAHNYDFDHFKFVPNIFNKHELRRFSLFTEQSNLDKSHAVCVVKLGSASKLIDKFDCFVEFISVDCSLYLIKHVVFLEFISVDRFLYLIDKFNCFVEFISVDRFLHLIKHVIFLELIRHNQLVYLVGVFSIVKPTRLKRCRYKLVWFLLDVFSCNK
ncbi:hypothetical protein E4T44_03727 [Aureobasidium sp. EXF-8845]|nr:hypothetical protein E4T44_03727 [Aureobasidium sp. EXF-8845]KAI4854997.1 hypothetical protein E4T45_03571 [Aureobasidium sp. EXF-8846]